MQIDWFTLSAQIVNFIILLVLLKKLLFDRIVTAMDKREKRIASRLEEAEQKKAEAENERQSYENKIAEMEQKRETLIQEAHDEAEEEKKKLKRSAREEIETLREEWRQSLQNEKNQFFKELRKKTGKQVYQIARKLLADLADQEMEKQMISAFLHQMHNLPEQEHNEISKALHEDTQATIVSSFEIESTQRSKLTRSLNEIFDLEMNAEYEQSSDLICGIEFHTKERMVSWNMEQYLDQLEQDTVEFLSVK